jgi:thiamine transport system permease protein
LRPAFPWVGITLFLVIFFFYPLVRILWQGLNPEAFRTIEGSAFGRVLPVLGFTFFQAVLSTLLTLLLGLPAAFLFSRFRFRGSSALRVLTAIPFMLPTVVVAAGFNALLGPRGWVNLALMSLFKLEAAPIPFVGTLGAILLAHVFYNTTIVIRIVGNALAHLDPRLEQAARSLGASPWQVWSKVTFPLLRPALLVASVLVFIFDFTSFGVILLLGGPRFSTLEVEIYLQAVQYFNIPLAAVLSFIQLLCTLAFSILYSRLVARFRVTSTPRPAGSNLRYPGTGLEKSLVGFLSILLLAFFALPLLSLPMRSIAFVEPVRGSSGETRTILSLSSYSELFINRRESIFYVPPFRAVGNSLGYAGLTVLLSLGLGFPVARALARPGRIERLLDPILMLPLGASAVTLGLGFIVSFNKPPLRLLTSPVLVPLAHTLIALPFVIRTLQPALASIPERLRQAAAVLGATPRQAWAAVDWPIIARATLSAMVMAFTVSLGEFGAASLLVRPEYPTLPVAIAQFISQPGALNYGQAMAMSTILMAVCGSGILALEQLRLPGTGEF